jgi:ATP-dependent Lon protease
VGTLCRLLDRMRMPDGSMRIVLQGVRRVGLAGLSDKEGYFSATSVELPARDAVPEQLQTRVDELLALVQQLVVTDRRYPDELARVIALNRGLVASSLRFSYADCARLLVEHDARARLELLAGLVRAELARAELMSEVEHKVEERARRSHLMEQLEVIRGELGVSEPFEDEAAKLEERLAASALSPAARQRAAREVERLRHATAGAGDAARARAWMD